MIKERLNDVKKETDKVEKNENIGGDIHVPLLGLHIYLYACAKYQI